MGTEYYLQHPREQLFYKVLAHISNIVSNMYIPWWGYTFPKYFGWFYYFHCHVVRIFAKCVSLSQVLFIILNCQTVDQSVLITAITIAPIGVIVGIKAESAKMHCYKDLMKHFMNSLHIYNIYEKDKSNEFIKQKVIQVERISRFTAIFLSGLMAICTMSWILKPTIHNIVYFQDIMNKTKEFQYYIYLVSPFDYRYDLNVYIVLHSICIHLGIAAVTIVVTFDILNFICVFHLVGHIYVLKHRITADLSDDFNDDEVKEYLVNLIKYHAYIIKTFKQIQAAFGLNVAANYLQNLIEDGLFLYQLMHGEKENAFMYGIMILIYLGGLIIMSIVLEEIRRQNCDVYDYVYLTPWENMSTKNKKIFILFLQRTQTDLEFRAACNMKAGVQPALSIIKSMFSYYVMINARL